jgi:hypothetical protein
MKPPFALRRSSYPPSVLEKDVPKMEELELSSYNARYLVILSNYSSNGCLQPVVSDAIGTRSGFLPRAICSVFIQGEYEHTLLLEKIS